MSIMKRVSFIDGLTVIVRNNLPEDSPIPKYMLVIWIFGLPPPEKDLDGNDLPQGASYSVHWEKDGVPLAQYTNQTQIELAEGVEVVGNWSATVELHTPEVRADPYHLLRSFAHIEVYEVNSEPRVTFL